MTKRLQFQLTERFSLQEHVNSLESIKTELNLTTGKRQELERRLQHAQEEKESLTSSLEEASDRIHMLERHAREQETKLEVSSRNNRNLYVIKSSSL